MKEIMNESIPKLKPCFKMEEIAGRDKTRN